MARPTDAELALLLRALANDSKTLVKHYFKTNEKSEAKRCLERIVCALAAANQLQPEES